MANINLIPPGIVDVSTIAYNELIDRLMMLDLNKLHVMDIDHVTSSALPHLGEQFNVMGLEGWQFAKTERQKRDLIKDSIKLHRYKGTPYAIKRIFEILGIKAQLNEWFMDHPNFAPFYFELFMEKYPESIDLLISLINEFKNVRSHLAVMRNYDCRHRFILDYSLLDYGILSDIDGVDYKGIKLWFLTPHNDRMIVAPPAESGRARLSSRFGRAFYIYTNLLDHFKLGEDFNIPNPETNHFAYRFLNPVIDIPENETYRWKTFKAQQVLSDFGTLSGGEGFIYRNVIPVMWKLDDVVLSGAKVEIEPILQFFWRLNERLHKTIDVIITSIKTSAHEAIRIAIMNDYRFFLDASGLSDVLVMKTAAYTARFSAFSSKSEIITNTGISYPTRTFKAQQVLSDFGTLSGGEGFIGSHYKPANLMLDDMKLSEEKAEIIPYINFKWRTNIRAHGVAGVEVPAVAVITHMTLKIPALHSYLFNLDDSALSDVLVQKTAAYQAALQQLTKVYDVPLDPGVSYSSSTFKAQQVLSDFGALSGGEGFASYSYKSANNKLDEMILSEEKSEKKPYIEFLWRSNIRIRGAVNVEASTINATTRMTLKMPTMPIDLFKLDDSKLSDISNIKIITYRMPDTKIRTERIIFGRGWTGFWTGRWNDPYILGTKTTYRREIV